MKNIKKFKLFEKNSDFDYEFVKMCFIDIIDSSKIRYTQEKDFILLFYSDFSTPEVFDYGSIDTNDITNNKVKKYIKTLEDTKEIMNDVQVGINRVIDKYPNYHITISYDDGMQYGELMSTPTIEIKISYTIIDEKY